MDRPIVSPSVLLVLIIREAGLRSTLSARLSLVGADLITARSLDDPVLRRSVQRPAILIIEEETIAGFDMIDLVTLLDSPHWRQVVALCDALPGPVAPNSDPRLLRLERKSAPSAIAELVPRWQSEDS
jgi:hypothetical protein